jgi:hypothetical protein
LNVSTIACVSFCGHCWVEWSGCWLSARGFSQVLLPFAFVSCVPKNIRLKCYISARHGFLYACNPSNWVTGGSWFWSQCEQGSKFQASFNYIARPCLKKRKRKGKEKKKLGVGEELDMAVHAVVPLTWDR